MPLACPSRTPCRQKSTLVAMLVAFAAAVVMSPVQAQQVPANADTPPSAGESKMPDLGYPRFSAGSFWYQPIPRDVRLHENTEGFARDFARQVRDYYGHIAINFESYSSPVYTVGPAVPRFQVVEWDCFQKGFLDATLARDIASVPVPPYAAPADGTDSEMTIYEPATDTLWEFWNMHRQRDVWKACWGGRMTNVSRNPGIWQHPYGGSATGLPFSPGQILAKELRERRIDHVMGIAVVDAEAGAVSWPANRSDGWNPKKSPNRIPEGLRIRLDPAVDVDSLELHPIARTIAKAAQIYGFVVWDKAGAVTLRAENPKRYTAVGLPNPYPELIGDTPAYKLMEGFPWDRMQFLPVDYGKPEKENESAH